MAEYTQTYWNELLDKLRNGSITDGERYKLEKQALDDPFLFDALEGFTLYEKNEEDVESRRPFASIVSLPRIAVAASLVILVAVVFNLKTYTSTPEDNDNAIAMVLESEEKEQLSEIESNEGTMPSKSDLSSTVSNAKSEVGNSSSTEIETQLEELIEEETKPIRLPEKEVPNSTEIAEAPNQRERSTPAVAKREDSAEEDGAPDSENKEDVENFSIAVEVPTNARIELDKGNMAEEEITEASDMLNKEVLRQKNKGEEVLNVTDSASTTRPSKKEKTSPSIAYFEAVPVIGKKIFDEYAKERIDQRGLRQKVPQEVTIEFSIDENGRLTNFHHIFTGCPECGSFAISILQNSGEWKTVPPGGTGKARYTFMF
ncbi:MAG: hypothetical protein AAGA77_14930 [Bacteroidota bacterium]